MEKSIKRLASFKIDEKVYEKAKEKAQKDNTSVTFLVEQGLRKICEIDKTIKDQKLIGELSNLNIKLLHKFIRTLPYKPKYLSILPKTDLIIWIKNNIDDIEYYFIKFRNAANTNK